MYKFYSKILVQPPGYVHKALLIMKLTTLILFIFFLQVSAKSVAQKITLSEKNKPLSEIFDKIRLQTQYDFLVTSSLLKSAKPVTIDVKNAEVADVLKLIFTGQPLDYQIEDKSIIVTPKLNPVHDKVYSTAALIMVIGEVTDTHDNPLVGATVIIQRTKKGTNTGDGGTFMLKDVMVTDTLVVSYIGFAPRKIIAAGIDKGLLTIKLEETSNGLDEVVVQAYGQTTQRLTTGNIGHVDAVDIEKQPVINPIDALEGRIPGVVVTQVSGYADGPVKVEIRGRGAINPQFTSDPLYIIDGVPLTVLDIGGTIPLGASSNNVSRGLDQTGMSYAGGQSPLANINPDDIQSIDVLKDADATAIYGSRGANGVILITTKRGKAGPLQFNVSGSQGADFITRYWDMLNTAQYLDMRRDAFKNDGIAPTIASAPDLLVWNPDSYTNWQKSAYGGFGATTMINTSLSGGNDQTTFRIGTGYNTSKQVNTVSGGFDRGSVSYNLTSGTKDRRFTISLTGEYAYSSSTQIGSNFGTTLAPNAPPAFDSNGNLNYAGWGSAHGSFPFANFLQPYNSSDNVITTNLVLTYVILKGLNLSTSFGYNNQISNQTSFNPIAAQDPFSTAPVYGSSSFGDTKANNVIIEPQLNFSRLIGKGTINALIGGTYQSNTTNSLLVKGSNYTSDEFLKSVSLAPIQQASSNYGEYKYAGVFGRLGYNYENKYLLDFNGRRDGSSRFGPGNQFGNFGSVGAGWIMTEEKWIRDALPKAISFMKLRGSYGLTGSDGVGDYQYLSQWGNGSSFSSGLAPYNGVVPLSPQIQPNNDYHWQVNKKMEGNFDISFLEDKINLSAAYYRDRVNNQLIAFPTPDFTGFSSVTANSPADVQNQGWEFSLNSKLINKKDLSLDFSFNISFNNNTLLGYPDLAHSPYATTYKIGGSLNDIYLFQYAGVNPLTGQYTYVDHNHDGIIYDSPSAFPGTQNDDRYVVLNIAPKYTGGFSNVFRYKNFSITTSFAFAKQMGRNPFTGAYGGASNILTYIYNNTWTTVGQKNALFARFTTTPVESDYYFGGSTGAYTDDSYIQLQNLALAYRLPASFLKKWGVRSLSVNVNSRNLFVITSYKGIDPQTQSYGGQPPARNILGGLSASF